MTCDRCVAEATTSLAAARLCAPCKEAILAPIRARVLEREMLEETTHGRGRQFGLLQPEYGPLCADLRCDQCSATWVGNPGDPCWWCWDRNRKTLDWHAQAMLTPPDYDPDDRNYTNVMGAWIDRMAVAVEAGIITREEATRAYQRGARHGHAA